MKYALAAIVIIALGVLGWFFYPNTDPEVMPEAEMQQEATAEPQEKRAVAVAWDFRLIEDGVSDPIVPQTDVAAMVSVGGRTENVRLGSFEGSCAEQSIPEAMQVLRPDAVGYALCWFAGFGTEFVVRDIGTGVRIEAREVDEGSAEEGPVQGNFSTLTNIAL